MTEAELETLIDGFVWAIEVSPVQFQRWMEELGRWVLRHNEIPRPADIVNIIDPPPEELSAAVYVSLQKKAYSGEYLLSDERRFCEAFRAQEMGRVRGGSDTLRKVEQELLGWKQAQIGCD